MASTNKTDNYALNQWVGTDPVLMEDFNADNAKIDAALAALKAGELKMAVGSYKGSGSHGTANPNSLSFDFAPSLVIIRKTYRIPLNPTSVGLVLIRPMSSVASEMYSGGDSSNTREINIAWGEKSVSWWHDGFASDASYAANWQLNVEGDLYYYVAFGI